MAQSVLQHGHHALTIAALFHVDQIQHDDAAQISQPNLTRDFFHGFHVRARYGVFQTRRAAADKLPGVHVDRDERFCLIDN